MRPHIPPDLRTVRDAVGGDQRFDIVVVVGPGRDEARDPGARKGPEDRAAVRLEPRFASDPEGRAGGEAQQMWQEVARHIAGIDQELMVLDADVHMGPKDEQLLCELLHRFFGSDVPIELGDLLLGPVREGVRAGGGDLEVAPGGEFHHPAAQLDELRLHLRGGLADRGSHFDDRLVQLGLHLFEHHVARLQDLRDVRLEPPRLGVDDLVFFFDADGEAGGLHKCRRETGDGRRELGMLRCAASVVALLAWGRCCRRRR